MFNVLVKNTTSEPKKLISAKKLSITFKFYFAEMFCIVLIYLSSMFQFIRIYGLRDTRGAGH